MTKTRLELRAGVRLPIVRYRFGTRMLSDLTIPGYSGALLRGQLGAALRNLSCTAGDLACVRCPRHRSCDYPAVFESPPPAGAGASLQIPNAYVIEPPCLESVCVTAGSLLIFSMVLVGAGLQRLPVLIEAWRRAAGTGLGRFRSVGRLEWVECEAADGGTIPIWSPERAMSPHQSFLEMPSFKASSRVQLSLTTPLRLMRRGALLGVTQLTPSSLLEALVRRARLLLDLHADIECVIDRDALLRQARVLRDRQTLEWHDWSRYSARQQREMTLGGLVGDYALDGELDALMPWLWLGQYLHVGKNATLGLGRIALSAASKV